MSDGLIVSGAVPEGDGEFQRMHREDVLAPGYYWRVKKDFQVKDERKWGSGSSFKAGNCHLLLDVFEYDGAPHSVQVLDHPRRGTGSTEMMVSVFLEHMEPAYDADQVRQQEQQAILDGVQEMQDEMTRAASNPLLLPEVRKAADAAVLKFEQKMADEAVTQQATEEKRQKDLRRIHRRAARRSDAAGNPLVLKSVTISTDLDDMIRGGVNSEGLSDLTLEARRRTAIAEASANWLSLRARQLSDTLESLTPFYAEKGRVALARAKKAITYSKSITEGLLSLKLYTGDSVHVVPVTEGKSASTEHPLTIFQSKRFMDEELAVFADVSLDFDWESQEVFFRELASNKDLRDQVLPVARCVVSMAVRRKDLEYEGKDSIEKLRNNLENRRVFLLVRDGENVNVVYSTEPSHEYALRLFPTSEDVQAPFKGVDGSRIRLDEVSFIDAKDKFEAESLHYKRFLILLCGLDHRLKLMGDFYPPEKAMEFMTEAFQAQYFYFVEDDDMSRSLGGDLLPIAEFLNEHNTKVSSGSRIVVAGIIGKHCPNVERIYGLEVDYDAMPLHLVASREGQRHFVTVPTKFARRAEKGTAKAWLDTEAGRPGNWFLCVDTVEVETLRRHVFNRSSRAISIGWIRAFKKAIQVLEADLAVEAPMRDYLAAQAVEHAGVNPADVPALMHKAISSWRVAHRGAPAPTLDQRKGVSEILTLMYPAERVARSSEDLIDTLVDEHGWKPLRLVRTGKTGMTLYVEADASDRALYPSAMEWRWVKRVRLEFKKSGVSVKDTALVWLMKDRPVPGEIEIRCWDGFDQWLNARPATVNLKEAREFAQDMDAAAGRYGQMLQAGRATVGAAELDIDLLHEICVGIEDALRKVKSATHPQIRVPVGIVQGEPGKDVKYLYAQMSARQFVKRYGATDQYAEVGASYSRSGFRTLFMSTQPYYYDHKTWMFVQVDRPYGSLVGIDESAGLCDAVRRSTMQVSKGFSPSRYYAIQSWNRAADCIKGLAPHLRRDFYKEQSRRINDAKRFGIGRDQAERREEIKQLAAARYEPKVRSHLSSLLWDPSKGRSHANRYFSVTVPKADDAAQS